MKRTIAIASAALLLGGCASTPPVSDLRNGVRSATFVQYGTEPLAFRLGVVDTGSFWGQYGGGVGANVGGAVGIAAGEAAAAAGREDAAKKAPEAERALRALYGKHPMVSEVGRSVMPRLAQLWGVQYSPSQLKVVQPGTSLEDEQGNLTGFTANTDVVLVYSMPTLTLTEKQTVGRAFAAGFTMGTNTKMVAADTHSVVRAYKRDTASGVYKKVWSVLCIGQAMRSKVDYPFPEVMQSRDKAKEIFDSAMAVTIDACSSVLEAHAKG